MQDSIAKIALTLALTAGAIFFLTRPPAVDPPVAGTAVSTAPLPSLLAARRDKIVVLCFFSNT